MTCLIMVSQNARKSKMHIKITYECKETGQKALLNISPDKSEGGNVHDCGFHFDPPLELDTEDPGDLLGNILQLITNLEL